MLNPILFGGFAHKEKFSGLGRLKFLRAKTEPAPALLAIPTWQAQVLPKEGIETPKLSLNDLKHLNLVLSRLKQSLPLIIPAQTLECAEMKISTFSWR